MLFRKNSKRKGWGLGLTLFAFASLLPAQTELLPFINPELWTAIEANNNVYDAWLGKQWERIGQVRRELYEEERRPVLDPQAFGLRYAELTAIRRQGIARIAELAAANRKLLTPAQLAPINALVVNQQLTALLYAAPCEYWFTRPPTAENPIDVYDVIYTRHRLPECAAASLADYLDLSPATRADFAARREQLFLTFDQLLLNYKKHVAAFEAAREASPLDPIELGRASVSILQVFRDFGDRRTDFSNRRHADLTPAQQAKLKAVNDAVLDTRRAELAECYGLFAQPVPIILSDLPFQNSALVNGIYGYYRSGCLLAPPV